MSGMVLLHDADKKALLEELAERRNDRQKSGDDSVYFASANACTVGFDITVSWSDGVERSSVRGCKILKLDWDDVAELALMFGHELSAASVNSAAELITAEGAQ